MELSKLILHMSLQSSKKATFFIIKIFFLSILYSLESRTFMTASMEHVVHDSLTTTSIVETWFSSISEAYVRKSLEEYLLDATYKVMYLKASNLQPHNSVLPVAEGLEYIHVRVPSCLVACSTHKLLKRTHFSRSLFLHRIFTKIEFYFSLPIQFKKMFLMTPSTQLDIMMLDIMITTSTQDICLDDIYHHFLKILKHCLQRFWENIYVH